jgi:hypothetical protein
MEVNNYMTSEQLSEVEKRMLRRIKWRAFWNGFFGFFYPPILKGPHIFDRFRRS